MFLFKSKFLSVKLQARSLLDFSSFSPFCKGGRGDLINKTPTFICKIPLGPPFSKGEECSTSDFVLKSDKLLGL